jgi:hypothetical protein
MVKGTKVLMSMCIIMMLMCFFIGCSYSDKPSEEEMKKEIISILEFQSSFKVIFTGGKTPISKYINFDSFKINNSFYKVINNQYNYCVDISGNINKEVFSYDKNKPEQSWIKSIENLEGGKYRFVKKDNKWNGFWGWEEPKKLEKNK